MNHACLFSVPCYQRKKKKKESEKRFDKIYAISELLNNNIFFFHFVLKDALVSRVSASPLR